MQVYYVSEGQQFPVWSLEGKRLTVEGITIDLEAEMQDCQNVITITKNSDGSCGIGLAGKSGYVADIEIPPVEYQEEVTGEGDEKEVRIRALPLDIDTVVLKLWPVNEDTLHVVSE